MMDILNITKEEEVRISQEIEYFLEFTRDVLNDPGILEHIPDMSDVHAIPKKLRDPNQRYDIETPRFLAIVTPPRPVEESPEPKGVVRSGIGSGADTNHRHVTPRDAATRRRRTRRKLDRRSQD